MKKIGIILFVATLAIGLAVANLFPFGRSTGSIFNFSMNLGGVRGSGRPVSEKRDLGGFKAVEVGGVFQVDITVQKEFSVEVEADDNLVPLIETEVNEGVLTIEADKRLKSNNPIRLHIGAPDIDQLRISGVANVTVDGVQNTDLSVESSGASKLKIAGETANLTVDISGAAKIEAEELKAGTATVDASGASHANINVSGELRTDASGASRITYSGSPLHVEKNTSGAGSVRQK